MKGAEQTCRDAGMDEYLTKPIDRAMLEKCVNRYLPPSASKPYGAPGAEFGMTSANPPTPLPVDWPALLVLVGDEDLARELAALYIENSRQGLADIDEALGRGNIAALGKKAHEISGASANVYARVTSAAAAHLEAAAQAGQDEMLPHLAERLRQEFGCAEEFLRAKVA
jgi:HPt (histidine-containing phosphotransfer) domain-containing protein